MRRLLMFFVLILILAGVVYFFMPAKTQQPAIVGPTTNITFVALISGLHSQVDTRTNYLITTQDELGELWGMTDANTSPPKVDFTKDQVIAIFGGQQPTAGYEVAVSQIADGASKRYVTVEVTKPGSTCILPQVVTSPYEIVEMPKSALPLTHIDTTSVASCTH